MCLVGQSEAMEGQPFFYSGIPMARGLHGDLTGFNLDPGRRRERETDRGRRVAWLANYLFS